jgi:aminopeptidase YwaD
MGPYLCAHQGKLGRLHIEARLAAAHGATVVGRCGPATGPRTVVCAHFDTKHDTPGAIDNAAGVAALLALARALQQQRLLTGVELVAFDGEDHYAAPGQVAYLQAPGLALEEIQLVVNIDGAGLCGRPTTLAYFDCPEPLATDIRRVQAQFPAMRTVPPWPQGDHSIFWMQGVPCIALTSDGIEALVDNLVHTPDDTIDGVDAEEIGQVVRFLHRLIAQSPC